MPTSHLILWLDLETTGNRPHDEIIEVGAALTHQDYSIVSTFSETYRTTLPVSEINDRVFDMHVTNGLWKETMKSRSYAHDRGAEAAILSWLGKNSALKGGDYSLPLAGSGTSHFDRRYIERDWPRLAKRLTFWNLDIGVVRRFMRSWLPEDVWGALQSQEDGVDPKTHRALDDVMLHISEARDYRSLIKEIGGQT